MSVRTGAVRRGRLTGKGEAMQVMVDRVAGLDVGKDSVTVCVRTPGPRWAAQRDADVQDDHWVVAAAA
jgi:hypothetical protein